MTFGIYLVGTLILIGGLVYAGHIMHLAPHWVAVMALIVAGLGIMGGVQNTRQKDPS